MHVVKKMWFIRKKNMELFDVVDLSNLKVYFSHALVPQLS